MPSDHGPRATETISFNEEDDTCACVSHYDNEHLNQVLRVWSDECLPSTDCASVLLQSVLAEPLENRQGNQLSDQHSIVNFESCQLIKLLSC